MAKSIRLHSPKQMPWSARRLWRGMGDPVHLSPVGRRAKRAEGQEGKVPWQQFAGPEDIKNQVPHPYSRTCTLGATLGKGSVLRPDLRVYVCATSKKWGFGTESCWVKEIGIYMSRIPESWTRSCQDIYAAPEANHMNNSSIRDKPLNILGRYWARMMCCSVSYNSDP